MITNQLALLKTKRFLPLFITQFFGAFNDNVFKNALAILITYHLSYQSQLHPELVITISAGLFIFPFFLFSSLAGQIADKFEKSFLIRQIKFVEIIIMLFAGVGFYLHSVSVLLFALFLLGTQATFFGPIKYAILPDHLDSHELVGGNALLETGTFLAILFGTMLGGTLAAFNAGATFIASLALLFAICGYLISFKIPKTTIAAPSLKIRWNFTQESRWIIKETFKDANLYLAIMGISWFWLVGATYLSLFPTYARDVLRSEPSIVTLFLTVFTAGIGVGSMICNRLLKGRIDATYVPLATVGMSIFAIDLIFASHQVHRAANYFTLLEFLGRNWSLRILVDLFLLAVCGGIYIVPLYAILQNESKPAFRSRVFAANNIMNALFMVVAAIISGLMFFLHFEVTQVFFVIAVANLAVAVYICNLLPEELIKSFLIWLFKIFYRAEVIGLENYFNAGNRVLIIANHTSFLDAALLAALLPDKLTFAIDTQIARKWWMKLLLKLVNTYSIDPMNPLATKSLIEYLRDNKHVVIFPEGRITVTGALMKIYEGPGLIADKADAKLLPVRIDGAQYTPFSYLKGKIKIRWFPKITLTVLEPRTFDLPETLNGRERREYISAQLYDIMTDTIFFSSNLNETLFQSLFNSRAVHGGTHLVIEDIERKPMSFNRLILSSIVLGKRITKVTRKGEYVGILLPNSVANVVTFFALQFFQRIPAMLNFSTGSHNLLSACRTANIQLVYTSRRFVQLGDLTHLIDALASQHIKIIYLEDLRQQIGFVSKMVGKCLALFARYYYHKINKIKKNDTQVSQSPAVVLFTSGSEGAPKGVVLSHQNLQANRFQLTARVDFSPTDRIFNALPMFHSFGLNIATLLPIVSGMPVFLYPSPLHYRIIPELCYDVSASIFFGTDTFLLNYAKYAHPYNFYSVRYVFAGAEKLREETRRLWMQKFGLRIMEGYGATEASPVLSANTRMQYKLGTVGRLMPGVRYELKEIPGITDGARLYVSGPNIMLGYMFVDRPCEIVAPKDGWHDTGDIVSIDAEGYVTIKGRAKRFAKIAGEMVSLASVEEEIYSLWPEFQHAIISKPDERKGEQIILVTNHPHAESSAIVEHFKQRGIADISLPRKIFIRSELPLMGSGKVDYQAVLASVED